MHQSIEQANALREDLTRMQRDARGLVAELRGIAEALHAQELEDDPHYFEELAREVGEVRDRQDAAWFQGMSAVINTTDDQRILGRR
jgi:hypothetical protein